MIDYGGQYSQLIARRLRECGVFSELLPHHTPLERIAARKPRASCSPVARHRSTSRAPRAGARPAGTRRPGARHLLRDAAARARAGRRGRSGRGRGVRPLGAVGHRAGPAARRHAARAGCWMSHRDTVFSAPPGFAELASSTTSPVAAFENADQRSTGSSSTRRSCTRPTARDPDALPDRHLRLRHAHGRRRRSSRNRSRGSASRSADGRVICGLSGGVDSSVAALLVHRADRRPADVRLRRPRPDAQGRGRAGRAHVPRHVPRPLVAVDAEDRFLERLAGVTEPEAKRKAIGAEFIRVFEEEAAKLDEGARSSSRGRCTPT